MSILFEKSSIGALELRNRFIRSATWEGMARPDGSVTPELEKKMVELAEGGVGLIITGHAYVSSEGQAGPRQMGIHSDEMIPWMKDMTDAVHQAGGRAAAQLAHAGCLAGVEASGAGPVGPSARPDLYDTPCSEAGVEDIERIADAFAAAAVRARRAGFDAVQIHAAHGYLLSQFLSPFFNERNDSYDGDQEGRAKLLLDVIRRVRNEAGKDYPVLVKMNSEDLVDGGLTMEQMLETARMLEREGVDAVELSGGTAFSGRLNPLRMGRFDTPEKEVFYRRAAEAYKERIGIPLLLVGGIRSFETAEGLVAGGLADFISLSRPLICEPDLVDRWKSGDRRPSLCRSDNRCIQAMRQGEDMKCVTRDEI